MSYAIKSIAKGIIKTFIPIRLQQALRKLQQNLFGSERQFKGLSNKQIFEKIYRKKMWGKGAPGVPYSGSGSHKEKIVSEYVKAVTEFIREIGADKTFIDLGCGDFNIGKKIAPLSKKYIGCDIVEDVIEHLNQTRKSDTVEFLVLDLVDDPLPNGDIIFVRLVLQHLKNDDIKAFVEVLNASNGYSHLILTEHLPADSSFIPNIDKPTGTDNRVMFDSGVDITKPPFNLSFKSQRVICEVVEKFGQTDAVIRTTAYSFI